MWNLNLGERTTLPLNLHVTLFLSMAMLHSTFSDCLMCGIFVHVEIKGAVPRSVLPTPKVMKGNIHENTPSIMHKDVQEYRKGRIKKKKIPPWERVMSATEKNNRNIQYICSTTSRT